MNTKIIKYLSKIVLLLNIVFAKILTVPYKLIKNHESYIELKYINNIIYYIIT